MATSAEDPFDIGAQRASRDTGTFSFKNTFIIRESSNIAGMILSYKIDDPYMIDDINDYPEVVRPLIKLESKVPGSWYINAIAIQEAQQGKGIAKQLLKHTESHAKTVGINQLSLIVASDNTIAKQLYIKLGYKIISSVPVVPFPGSIHGGEWELMTKQI